MPTDQNKRYRVLLVCSHPVQYASPIFRRMATDPRLDIQVAYCSLEGAEARIDPGFGREVKWDVPLLEGFPWTFVPNRSRKPSLERFWGLINSGLWGLVRKNHYDAVVIYTGYRFASFWIALLAAKLSGTAFLFGTDAWNLEPRDGKSRTWKMLAKKRAWPWIFRMADQIIVPSRRTTEMMQSLGIPPERITLTPYCVDNEWWQAQAAVVDRDAVRSSWQVPPDAVVVLFCAKLQPWKRPLDLVRAFAKANMSRAFLVFSGDGPLREEIEQEAAVLGIAERTRMLGFMNQSQLPAVYCASDILVLPSEYDAFGVVVNEAMLCGCAVAVSDHVGAGGDLVRGNGVVYPCGDTDALAAFLEAAIADGEQLRKMGDVSRSLIANWSPRENIGGLITAVKRANGTRTKSGGSV